jgi:hypothetical protein
MQTRILVWARRVAAVLIFLLAGGAAPAAGLLAPYFLTAQTANILLPTISAVASFTLWAWAGTRLALSCWEPCSTIEHRSVYRRRDDNGAKTSTRVAEKGKARSRRNLGIVLPHYSKI